MKASAWRTIGFFGLKSDSFLFSCVSTRFIGGKMMAVRAWELGCKYGYEEPSNHPELRIADNEIIDLLSVVPSQMLYFTENPELAAKVRRFLVGGAPLDFNLRNRILELGLEVWESYGMTETCSHIALRRVQKHPTGFIPLEGIKISQDERGCLVITIGDEKFQTNDIVEFKEENTFEIKGRIDNVIITGGRKAFPEQIEEKLSGWLQDNYAISKEQFAITSLSDKKWGEKIVLAISHPQIQFEVSEIKEADLLDSWQIPKEVISVSAIPLTDNGKIDRGALRSLISEA